MSIYKEDYYQISLAIIQKFSKTLKFDLYVKRSAKNFTKIFKRGDTIDWDRVQGYYEKGIKYFYVTSDEYKIYSVILERLGEFIVDSKSSLSTAETVDILKELSQYTITDILTTLKVDSRTLGNASNVVNTCIDLITRDAKTMVTILKQISGQKYILKHSMAVSLFSVMLAEASGIESQTNLSIIGLGGFLHDIGVGQLTFDPEDKKVLTAEERKEMWRHPELGKQMLDNLKGVRSEVSQIVYQHHEQPNGHGYPNGMKGPEIYYPAKIIAICDAFSAMITKRSFREAMSVSEAVLKLLELPGHLGV